MDARTQAVEPDRVVDPPEVRPPRRGPSAGGTETVRIDQTAMLTLPSGASYSLTAGETLELQPEDAAFIIDQGYGSKVDDPSEG